MLLFLFTSLHEQKQLLGGRLPDGFTEGLIEQAKALSFEQQRHFVHQQLRQQLVDIASSIHDSLLQAQDPRPAAAAFEQAWQQMHPQLPQQQQEQQQFRRTSKRMPGYPRIDVGNPYLTARYDHGIVDSLPWGSGWLAAGGAPPSTAVTAASLPSAPASKGLIGRMVAASDGPRKPIPGTTWVNATSAEAAQLEMLEGRHPLALAHFANHPPPGAAPNAVIANFSFKLPAAGTAAISRSSSSSSDKAASSSSSDQAASSQMSPQSRGDSCSSSSSSSSAAPWLRAYVPNIDYAEECTQQHLLNKEVSCVGLVAVAPLQSGGEVLFNYRLSPALLGRPAWYSPVDQNEENMRWA
ncbi:hypothetical protein COO60DRAFT_1635090 [Scenedesmus sp. NREL 46B-D3]|nr:hypothetical protein COO60DRAFT_1635090 [Scenedesmus sp. NREL 46B-D3]